MSKEQQAAHIAARRPRENFSPPSPDAQTVVTNNLSSTRTSSNYGKQYSPARMQCMTQTSNNIENYANIFGPTPSQCLGQNKGNGTRQANYIQKVKVEKLEINPDKKEVTVDMLTISPQGHWTIHITQDGKSGRYPLSKAKESFPSL